jgi:hypothetical protein
MFEVEIVKMIEKLDCALSKRAIRPYIYGHTSANAYVPMYVLIRLNALSPTAISSRTNAEIYLYNMAVNVTPHQSRFLRYLEYSPSHITKASRKGSIL